uniref:WRKY transcription factor n=1 Tax=Caenorhabditis tropicalis TaxID=1561998 RepID=A0A1I7UB11_9PELO
MDAEEGEKESSSQYCKGFFDALRVVQSSNKFEFQSTGLNSPVLPALPSATAFSPITPATASDMHTIVMSILGNTPISGATTIPLSSPTLLPIVSSNGEMEMDMKHSDGMGTESIQNLRF